MQYAPCDPPPTRGPSNNNIRSAPSSLGLAKQADGTHAAEPTKLSPTPQWDRNEHECQAHRVRTKEFLLGLKATICPSLTTEAHHVNLRSHFRLCCCFVPPMCCVFVLVCSGVWCVCLLGVFLLCVFCLFSVCLLCVFCCFRVCLFLVCCCCCCCVLVCVFVCFCLCLLICCFSCLCVFVILLFFMFCGFPCLLCFVCA